MLKINYLTPINSYKFEDSASPGAAENFNCRRNDGVRPQYAG